MLSPLYVLLIMVSINPLRYFTLISNRSMRVTFEMAGEGELDEPVLKTQVLALFIDIANKKDYD